MTIFMTVVGFLAGIGVAIVIYPFFLKYRAAKLLKQCQSNAHGPGDPTSNYFALLVYQMTGVYQRLERKDTDQAQTMLSNILASYCSFMTRKRGRSQSEQDTLDAIREACNQSETLRRVVDERVNSIKDKTVDQMLEELEKELAKPLDLTQ